METITIEPDIHSYHIDSGRHVSNIVYIKWMEAGRLKMLEQVGMPVHELETSGVAPALTRTEINYRKPLYLGDRVRVELYLSELRKISGKIRFTFYRGEDEIVAEGEQEAVFFNLETKRPYRLSTEQRERFMPYLATDTSLS